MVFLRLVFALGSAALGALAAPAASSPTVKLDNGTFIGKSVLNVHKFYGIPFAQPPCVKLRPKVQFSLTVLVHNSIGDLRLRRPQPIPPYSGTTEVTAYGPSCPQQAVKLDLPLNIPSDTLNAIISSIYGVVFPDNEDCKFSK